MASTLLAPLEASVTKARTVIGSATTFVNGVAPLIAAAVAAAIANGATAEELQPVSDLGVALDAEADALAAAILANTPAAGPVV
jgi:hypothetical protein